jgi:hypothetical protein
MFRSPAILATTVCALSLGFLDGCAKPEKPDTPPLATVSYNHEISLADFTITAPDTLPAGWTTFKATNKAQQLHHATLVRLDSAHTVDELVAAMKNPGPPPSWATWLGGPQQESEVTVNLVPGNYAWICVIPGTDNVPHFVKGMYKAFTVVAATTAGPAEPKADVEVALKDYTWTMSTPITAGEHMLKLHTEPGQPHEAVILRVAAGKTSKDVLAWMEKMAGPPPVESVQGISAMQAGEVQYEKMTFTPGHYAILCFVPDAKDGKAHFMHGMTLDFDVK